MVSVVGGGPVEVGGPVAFPTSADVRMGAALDRLHTDLVNSETFHDDDPRVREHYGNAFSRRKGSQVLVRKENPNSSRKIDTVPTDAMAYQARADAIKTGWTSEPTKHKTIHFR